MATGHCAAAADRLLRGHADADCPPVATFDSGSITDGGVSGSASGQHQFVDHASTGHLDDPSLLPGTCVQPRLLPCFGSFSALRALLVLGH